MNWPEQGIHHGVPFSIYREDDITPADTRETVIGKAVSKSMLTKFAEDPGTWKRSIRKETTAAMRTGSLVDCLLLEPDKFETRYALSPYADFRKKEAQEWRSEMAKGGVEVITEDQMATAQDMVDACKNHYDAGALLYGAKTQLAFRHATKHGFDAKGLIDAVPLAEDTLVDLKTCRASALENKRSLQREIFEWGYHIQAGAYLDGFNIAGGEERTRFKFVFVSSAPPHTVAVIELPLAAILLGAEQYRAAMQRFADCLMDDVWPSQWDGTVELDLPEYAYT